MGLNPWEHVEADAGELTPRHLLRQLEPSLLVKGQTTSLLASETENEPVNEARGGIVCIYLLYCRAAEGRSVGKIQGGAK